MMNIDRCLRLLFALLLLASLTSRVVSQDDVFDDVPDSGAAAEEVVDDPSVEADPAELDAELGVEEEAAEAAPERPAAGTSPADPAASAPPAPVNTANQAAVDVILQSQPKTADALLRAVDQLVRLGRVDAAQPLWEQLNALTLSDLQRAQLHQQFGSAVLIRLARVAELNPAPTEFVRQVFTAASQVARDPARMARLVAQLDSTDKNEQYRAAVELLRAGSYAVPALIEEMAKETPDAPRRLVPVALEIMQRLGADAVDPLVAYLSSDDENVRVQAIRGLAVAAQPRSLPYLVRPLYGVSGESREAKTATQAWQRLLKRIPDPAEAKQLLAQAAERAYVGDAGTGVPGDQQRWLWSQADRRPVPTMLNASDSAALSAARLYHDLHQLEPQQMQYQVHYLVSRLELEQVVGGLDQPLRHDEHSAFAAAAKASSFELNRALAQSLQDDHDAAAIALCEVIGAQNDIGFLQAEDAKLSPLATALTHESARVRFAATQAIAQLQPKQPFAGQGHWEDALQYFSASRGKPLAVVAHPQPLYGQRIAGLLTEFGYQSVSVTTYHDLLKRATESPDVELIFVSDAMNEETIWAILEALRSGPKTARAPVAILSRVNRLDEMELIADDQPRTLVLPEAADGSQLASFVPQLERLAGRDRIATDRRDEQAAAARGWLEAHRARMKSTAATGILPLKN